jgi:hypothetical protein
VPWARLDDDFHDNAKILGLSHPAFRLYVCAITYCRRHRTGGFLSASAAWALCGQQRVGRGAVGELVARRAWHEDAARAGYRIHDFAEYQIEGDPTAARRMALFRDADLRRVVKERDGGCCRYCGVAVRWEDRKGPSGGTYDHVDPAGVNRIENLVVACRGCNARKGNRRPDAAGMRLRPAPDLDRDLDFDPDQIQSGSRSVQAPSPMPSSMPDPMPNPPPMPAPSKPEHEPQKDREKPAVGGVRGGADAPRSTDPVVDRGDATPKRGSGGDWRDAVRTQPRSPSWTDALPRRGRRGAGSEPTVTEEAGRAFEAR